MFKTITAILVTLFLGTAAKADKVMTTTGTYMAFKQVTNQLGGGAGKTAATQLVWYAVACQGGPGFWVWSISITSGETFIVFFYMSGGAATPPSFPADFPNAMNVDCTTGNPLLVQ